MLKKFHWIPQEKKIFYHEQFLLKISNGEFFPNYGIYCITVCIRTFHTELILLHYLLYPLYPCEVPRSSRWTLYFQCTVYQYSCNYNRAHNNSLLPVYSLYTQYCLYTHNIQVINQLMYKNWSHQLWIVMKTNTKEREQWKEYPEH